ncbi:MAG TPA: type II toxin-antitoxin system VapB family antitoxin [bacterium]|nr:type II toxin-antitoxin system VapB family antitoxin [bacterium]
MRTTINVDDAIIDNLMEVTEAKSKTSAVNKALTDYVRLKRKELLLSLPGKIKIDVDWRKTREPRKHG